MHVNALVRTKLYKHEPLKAGLTHPDNAVGDLNTPACTLEWAKALCTCSKVPPVFILSTVKHTLRIQFPELSLLSSLQRLCDMLQSLEAFPDWHSALIKPWFYNRSIMWQNHHSSNVKTTSVQRIPRSVSKVHSIRDSSVRNLICSHACELGQGWWSS